MRQQRRRAYLLLDALECEVRIDDPFVHTRGLAIRSAESSGKRFACFARKPAKRRAVSVVMAPSTFFLSAYSDGSRRHQLAPLYSEGASSEAREFVFQGKKYAPRGDTHWKTTFKGLENLANANRIEVMGSVMRYRRFVQDFPVIAITDQWESTQIGTQHIYAVQTSPIVVRRGMLMTTDPGDLVLDPTCGSGTTAYVAEQWRRRWITTDVSRVPLALGRQRLLTATFPYYQLKDEARGPAGASFTSASRTPRARRSAASCRILPLNRSPTTSRPGEEILVDRPGVVSGITRVTGLFVVEATDGFRGGRTRRRRRSRVRRELRLVHRSGCSKCCASHRCSMSAAAKRSISRTSTRPPRQRIDGGQGPERFAKISAGNGYDGANRRRPDCA